MLAFQPKMFCLGALVVTGCLCNLPTAQAQFGGLQIEVGRYGGYRGGGYSLAIPFGVGPSIPPTSRAFLGPDYGLGYRGYYGYAPLPLPGIYGVSPFDYPPPSYRTYGYNGSGPYLGNGTLNYQQQLDLYHQQQRAEQSRLYSQQIAPNSLQSPTYQSPSNRAGRPVNPGDDLRPGMVLPDGSTVLSVGPIGSSGSSSSGPETVTPAPNVVPEGQAPPVQPGSRRSNRAAF